MGEASVKEGGDVRSREKATRLALLIKSGFQIAFLGLWLFILSVSLYDSFLVLDRRNHLDELNPVGRKLIELNGGQVWYLLAAKFLGTVTACAVLLVIYQNSPRVGMVVALVLSAFQLGLLSFLLLF